MRVYLDSSALLKRVVAEDESPSLRESLDEHRRNDDVLIASTLAWIEVSRALRARHQARIGQTTSRTRLSPESSNARSRRRLPRWRADSARRTCAVSTRSISPRLFCSMSIYWSLTIGDLQPPLLGTVSRPRLQGTSRLCIPLVRVRGGARTFTMMRAANAREPSGVLALHRQLWSSDRTCGSVRRRLVPSVPSATSPTAATDLDSIVMDCGGCNPHYS